MAVTPINAVYRWPLLGVNMKTTGTTGREMVAAVASKKFVMTGLLVVPATRSGTGTPGEISLGVGSGHDGDLIGGETGIQLADTLLVTQPATFDDPYVTPVVREWFQVDVGTNGVWLKVVTASTYTTDTCDVHLFGFYR